MAVQHTRDATSLTDALLDAFLIELKAFLVHDNSLPHRPTHLVASQASTADAFHAKLDEYYAARTKRNNATTAFGDAVTAIREKLRWMQMALPGMTPGSDVHYKKFGFDKPVPISFKYNPGLKQLSWDTVVDATMYEVRQEGSFAPVYFGSDTSFVLDLPAGKYKLRVRAGDEMQNWWTEWSDPLSVVV